MQTRHINIVGGTKGLGKVFLEDCKKQNWTTSVVARNANNENNEYQCDITNQKEISNCLEKIHFEKGNIDSVVFFQRFRGDTDSWKGHFDVSVKAIDEYIKESVNFMNSDSKMDKSIVIVSSISSLYVAEEQDAAYHASRTAQIGLMKYYAHTLGSLGIRVNAVSFGNIIKITNEEFFEKNKKLKSDFENCSALKRMGTSEEIAKVIKFLVSTDSSWITGQNLVVDGGSSLAWIESRYR